MNPAQVRPRRDASLGRGIGSCILPLMLVLAGCGVTPSSMLPTAPDGTAAGTLPTGNPIPPVAPGPTELDQLMLERINRARLLPAREAAGFGIAIDEGVPGQLDGKPHQALAFNATLALAARRHADDMLANDYFAHRDLAGMAPADRMRAAGYPISATGENLAWDGTTGALDEVATVERMHAALFVDQGIADRGHRLVMLHPSFREVGVSVRRGRFGSNGTSYEALMAVQDYASSAASNEPFLLGVVYEDRNRNGQYDFGEGTTNLEISIDGVTHTTGLGGGYSVQVTAGSHRVAFGTGVAVEVIVRDKNVKLDLVDGSRVVTNHGVADVN